MSSDRIHRLGILGSGKGTNKVAIAQACQEGRLPAKIVLVLSDVENAGILARARDLGLPGHYMEPGRFRTKLDDAAEAAYAAAARRSASCTRAMKRVGWLTTSSQVTTRTTHPSASRVCRRRSS